MNGLLQRLVVFESDVAYQEPATEVEPEFRHVPGRMPILLSAPHGAVHTRDGKLKEEDEFTAGLAMVIGERIHAHVLYSRRRSSTDPNWYRDVPYKMKLRDLVRSAGIGFVLDLHGASEERSFSLAIGTMKGTTCPLELPKVMRLLESHGFAKGAEPMQDRLDVDSTFTGIGLKGQETITRFVWEQLHVPVAQFELHPSMRIVERRGDASRKAPFRGDPDLIERAIVSLSDVAGALLAGQGLAK